MISRVSSPSPQLSQVTFCQGGAQQALNSTDEEHKHEGKEHMNYTPPELITTQNRLNEAKQSPLSKVSTFFETVAKRLVIQPKDLALVF